MAAGYVRRVRRLRYICIFFETCSERNCWHLGVTVFAIYAEGKTLLP